AEGDEYFSVWFESFAAHIMQSLGSLPTDCVSTSYSTFVMYIEHKGKYYEMFSGGNWQNKTYGVSYAVSDRVLREDEWEQVADGEQTLPILRTIPHRVIGPGHNSVVRGLDNREWFCVYHRWSSDNQARVLAIDRLDWVGERMFVIGATTTPQPSPNPPTIIDYFNVHHDVDLGTEWQCEGGKWVARDGQAIQEVDTGIATALCRYQTPYFIAELGLKLLPHLDRKGAYGFALNNSEETVVSFKIRPANCLVEIEWLPLNAHEGERRKQEFTLPAHFNCWAFHLLSVEVNGLAVHISMDENAIRWQAPVRLQPLSIALLTEETAAAFAGFSLTHSWNDLFMEESALPLAYNYVTHSQDAGWTIREKSLRFAGQPSSSIITKGPLPIDYELLVNLKACAESPTQPLYGILPALDGDGGGAVLRLLKAGENWALQYGDAQESQYFSLPVDFSPYDYQQFRFRKRGKFLTIHLEGQSIGEIKVPVLAERIGLEGAAGFPAVDRLAVTAIG
ncbi:MAG: hypothetical protein AB1757_15940, partial [Acidobacteriota bacterium]